MFSESIASESLAGAMYAHAVTGSSSDLKIVAANHRHTPRKIPGVSRSPKRGYLSTDRALLGNGTGSLYAMLMLGQLRYYFEPDEKTGKPQLAQRQHEGHFWVAASLTYWEQQLGLTRKEARAGIACLKKSQHLIELKTFRFGNNDVEHFRLTDEGAEYAVSAPPVPNGHTLCPMGTPTSLKYAFEVQGVEVQDTPLAETTKKQTSLSPDPGPAVDASKDNLTLPPEKQTSTPAVDENAKWIEPTKEAVGASAVAWSGVKQAYVDMYQEALDAARKNPKAKSDVDFYRKMRDAVQLEVGDDERDHLRKICGYARIAGIDARSFFDWLTPMMYQRVSLDLGDDARPAALYLLAHRGVFFAYYLEHAETHALAAA